jgi:hypothetical protein
VYYAASINYSITITTIITIIFTLAFIIREIWQMAQLKKRSTKIFHTNYGTMGAPYITLASVLIDV